MTDRPLQLPRKAFFSPRELAALAYIHPSTVLEQIHSGKLYAIRLSDRIYRIPRAVVVNLLYPAMVQQPAVRSSPDPSALATKDRRRRDTEGTSARRRPRKVVARSH